MKCGSKLSSTTFRINFGDVVLEVPNEKTDAGLDVGLYKWNGGNHQKVVFEKQEGYEGTVVRMKMQHSNMYLRSTTDGERVIQSWADDWEWNQVWRILPKEKDEPNEPDNPGETESLDPRQSAYSYGTSLRYAGGHLSVEIGSSFKNGAVVRILDLKGREVMRQRVGHTATINVKPLAPGLYHVVVSDGKRLDAKRFRR